MGLSSKFISCGRYFPHRAARIHTNLLVYGAASKDWFDWSAASDGCERPAGRDLLHAAELLIRIDGSELD